MIARRAKSKPKLRLRIGKIDNAVSEKLTIAIRTFANRHHATESAAPSPSAIGSHEWQMSHQQLVGENAEAIDRRCLHSQNDWPKRDRAATLASRQRELGWRKIAFGPDQHQDACRAVTVFCRIFRQDFLEMDSVGLE